MLHVGNYRLAVRGGFESIFDFLEALELHCLDPASSRMQFFADYAA